MKNIYIFGSIVRGEIDQYSDTDLLLITDDTLNFIDLEKYSLYTPTRIEEMYREGNPFAWHLHYESKLVYSDGVDFLKELKIPNSYKNCSLDLHKFYKLFQDSIKSIQSDKLSLVFDLAMVFLALRNFATCYSLERYEKPIFSRNSFEKLNDFPLILDNKIKNLLMMARISSTRGISYKIDEIELSLFIKQVDAIEKWFDKIFTSYECRI
ncbi:nucleotidyltransferase domain-containing protein [Flavobacterium sp. KACC 22763]|uniref:nucleotidyltransferase domain-containing protein n=1 Tax=Flavobacterium sp. KACC 22763 TaxID=3025668 RepID=UPI0023662805|nr:nucleotidyltransferase domain-containing protein [Flavobacterium sp. KACC 22763]WDF65468.1 nucleotidyltransferase domain-containing protein [Flavobacterium sp. KACC 22763]